jgi:hypothetical protein
MRRSHLRHLVRLWNDDGGALLATEFLICASILVFGTVSGLIAVREALKGEFEDMAGSIRSLDQSYSVPGTNLAGASSAGSRFKDPLPQPTPNSTRLPQSFTAPADDVPLGPIPPNVCD